MTERQITGKQVFFVTASAFTVIIGVNLTLAFKAVSTFPGLEVKNSYVASQSFEARRDAQKALGWNVAVAYQNDELALAFTTASSNTGRRKRVVVRVDVISGAAIGISSRQIAKPVAFWLGTIADKSPSIPQYIGRI